MTIWGLGDNSGDWHKMFGYHTHMTGYSGFEIMWRIGIRGQHYYKKYTGAYEREAAELEAKRIQDENVEKMDRMLAAKKGETLPKNFLEKSQNSALRLDWVPEEKRSPPTTLQQPVEQEKQHNLPKIEGLDMNFNWGQFAWE